MGLDGPQETLVDTHAHLNHDAFAADRLEIARGAREAGIRTILDVATDLPSARRSLELSRSHPYIFSTVGVHPHEAKLYGDEELAKLYELARDPRVKAAGEMGLDYHYNFSDPGTQQRVFDWQVRWARAHDYPVVVHVRDAFADAFEILSRGGWPRGVLHCFTGGLREARTALDGGMMISLSGMVTFKKAEELREVAAMVPLDRLLLETDAPYLSPVPLRGKRNQPDHVWHTARCVAGIRKMPVEDLARATSASADALFGFSGRES